MGHLMGAAMCSANSGSLHDAPPAISTDNPQVRPPEKKEPCEWCDGDR